MTYKRTPKPHSRLKNVYLMEDVITSRFLYRYIPLSCLTKRIVFKEPSLWTDKFESRFYRAKYNQTKYPGFPKKLYALCTTLKRDSEAAWKMYLPQNGEPLVQIKINRKTWLKYLNQFASTRYRIYEGTVNYELKESHIAILHRPFYQRLDKGVLKCYNVTGHDDIFNHFDMDSFLSLLLLKRSAYRYENEVRYFIVPSEEEGCNTELHLDTNWLPFIEEIRCSPADETVVVGKDFGVKVSVIDINEGTYIDGDETITIN